jgi:hypothetical protein
LFGSRADQRASTRSSDRQPEPAQDAWALRTIYGRAEQRRLREARNYFLRLGVDVQLAKPGQTSLARGPGRLDSPARSPKYGPRAARPA